MTATTFRRPATSVLADAADAADRLVHEYAARAAQVTGADPLAYWLAGAAVADSLGLPAAPWIRSARTMGASWQQIADALGTTKGAVHAKYRHVDITEEN